MKEFDCYYIKMQVFYFFLFFLFFPLFLSFFPPFLISFQSLGRTSGLHQERGSHGLLCIHSLKCPMSKHLPPPPSYLHSWLSGDLVVLAQAASLHFDFSGLLSPGSGSSASCHFSSGFRSCLYLSPGVLGCFDNYCVWKAKVCFPGGRVSFSLIRPVWFHKYFMKTF